MDCSCCPGLAKKAEAPTSTLRPIICLVPKAAGAPERAPERARGGAAAEDASPADANGGDAVPVLDDAYLKKHFKLPQRALYLDPTRRPLISFPMTQEDVSHFNLARKTKVNQQILDGYLNAKEAIMAPSVFPYAESPSAKLKKKKGADDEEETIYILQLPDWEYYCPVHKKTIKTPRFVWHSSKNDAKEETSDTPGSKLGGGPLNKPKPWLLSRHTDFDLMSQW